jgi:hypothetical protein
MTPIPVPMASQAFQSGCWLWTASATSSTKNAIASGTDTATDLMTGGYGAVVDVSPGGGPAAVSIPQLSWTYASTRSPDRSAARSSAGERRGCGVA